MVDETETSTTQSEIDARVEEANDLIGTEGVWSGRILYTGVELGLFKILDDDPTSASELAAQLDLDSGNTYRLLRAMAHFGVLDEDENQRFSLTPVGELFQADHSHSVQDNLLFNRSPEWAKTMLHMSDIVNEGGPTGFVREFGCDFFEYIETNPEFADRYNALMEFASRNHPDQILDALDAYDFSQFSHVCDVGGGRGRLLSHVLKANPRLQGTVLELPDVVAEEDQLWAPQLNVTERCTYVGGDMFERVPEADAYFLKWILHNFDDEECQQILSTIHESAPSDSRLFIIETVVPDSGTPHYAKRLDITMMVQTGGRERTKEEYAELLEKTRWRFVETWVPEEGPLSVLEAVRA
jgi:hypothetical protein